MQRTRYLYLIVAVLVVIFSLTLSSSAHSTSQSGVLAEEYISHQNYMDYYIGGESVGWSIDEGMHIGTTTIYYKFDDGVSDNVKEVVRSGFNKWSNLVTAIESPTATGIISTASEPYTTTVAMFHNASVNSLGHLVGWEITLNLAKSPSDATLAHELGHVIGLNDLYLNNNKNKLMYYNSAYRTVTSPTDRDLWGAQVILGLHYTHTFTSYRYYGIIGEDGYHMSYCNQCGGYAVGKVPCVYRTDNSFEPCIYCGTNRTY